LPVLRHYQNSLLPTSDAFAAIGKLVGGYEPAIIHFSETGNDPSFQNGAISGLAAFPELSFADL
jgi:hypothetical protein